MYVSEKRQTEDVDILALKAIELAEELRTYLNKRFVIAVQVREIRDGIGYRIYQVQKPINRHLVDVRPVGEFPPTQRVAGVLVISPAELIASKVLSFHGRRGKPKSGTDWRNVGMLLLSFPELKSKEGAVRERLLAGGADAALLAVWEELVAHEFGGYDEDSEFN